MTDRKTGEGDSIPISMEKTKVASYLPNLCLKVTSHPAWCSNNFSSCYDLYHRDRGIPRPLQRMWWHILWHSTIHRHYPKYFPAFAAAGLATLLRWPVYALQSPWVELKSTTITFSQTHIGSSPLEVSSQEFKGLILLAPWHLTMVASAFPWSHFPNLKRPRRLLFTCCGTTYTVDFSTGTNSLLSRAS